MTGRLAIDFGTSNTVLAVWDEEKQTSRTLPLSEYSRLISDISGQYVVPSVIHFADPRTIWIGDQIHQRRLYSSPHTFRWMKRYITNRTPTNIRIGDREISPNQAAEEYLRQIVRQAALSINLADHEEIALSVPVEAFEFYENWLINTFEGIIPNRVRLIDEPCAAALGYGIHLQPGDLFLVFDMGGGTHHAAVVLIDEDSHTISSSGKSVFRQGCRVVGKAGCDIGGLHIDQIIFQYLQKKHSISISTDNNLLTLAENIKEQLSLQDEVEYTLNDPFGNNGIDSRIFRNEFEKVLDDNGVYTSILSTVRSAINQAYLYGYEEKNIKAILMVGGGSHIPSFQHVLRQHFGKDLIKSESPFDAVARGAASFISGTGFFDFIQHDYAIRYRDPQTQRYEFKVVVNHGTAYPTEEPLCQLTVKGAYDGQTQLGLALFEMSRDRNVGVSGMELVFDSSGVVRLMPVLPVDDAYPTMYWINENNLAFLAATPPARKGEPRFEVAFHIDEKKRLLITARDLTTGDNIYNRFPVVKLN